MVKPVEIYRDRPMVGKQRERTVEAGTHGRLLRVCMDIARMEPEWTAFGPVRKVERPDGKTVLRQTLTR